MKRGGKALKVIQISDPHLCNSEAGTLLGLNTHASLEAVLSLVEQDETVPDLVIATGDISQDRSREAYLDFCRQMDRFDCPVIWLAGNHDDPSLMARIASRPELESKTLVIDQWKFIFLDTSVSGKVHGELSRQELQLLQSEIDNVTVPNVMVCLHHHPIAIDSRWLDKIGLRNAEDMFAITDACSELRAIVWGHIHQSIDVERNGVRMFASPSTCVQFEPNSENFSVGEQAPGYRWLHLFQDGRINSGVERADHIEFEVDLNSKGY